MQECPPAADGTPGKRVYVNAYRVRLRRRIPLNLIFIFIWSCAVYYVYVLWSEKLKKRYIGFSIDIKNRLEQHNTGINKFTSRGIPWKIIHTETYPTKKEAMRREKDLKGGQGRAWLDEKYPEYKRNAVMRL